MTQSETLTLLKTGRNVFVTGPAGSGKTHVINEYIKYLNEREVPVGITASTGIAATHMGGVTIHAWSGMGIRAYMDEHEIESLREKKYIAKHFSDTQVLIIDEVSMLHHFRFDLLDEIARTLRKSDKPFGGMQVVLCGDFFQLPPVSRMGEPESQFIYRSKSWKDAGFTICYLSEQHRQKDDVSLGILNEIRSGDVSDEAREQLRSRHNAEIDEIEPTRLFTHNADVDTMNDQELLKVQENEFTYEMSSKGKTPLVLVLKKSCLAPEILRLKKGARVMCVKNNFDEGYVNGTLGVIESCGPNVHPVIRASNGKRITIEPASWQINDGGKILAEITQYPLRLAWAITVHKSQGMSLDAVDVDLSKAFEPGMGYVALSRVRTFGGLTIRGINENALQVHPEVLEYDRHLRELSGKAESVLHHTDSKDIVREQEEFLARVAPMHSRRRTENGRRRTENGGRSTKGSARRKEPNVSTYEQTAVLVRQEKSIREMAKARGKMAETILEHIEKLKKSGSDINITYLKKEISPEKFRKIEAAFEEIYDKTGETLLSPVKSKVGPNVSFLEIRLARILLGY